MYKIVFVLTSCKDLGPVSMIFNIINHLDRNRFEPVLVTIYPETKSSRLEDFISLGIRHYYCGLDKVHILLGRLSPLAELLESIKPDVIDSVGIFPGYAVSRIMPEKQTMTIHNYMYDDLISLYGTVLGHILIKLQMYAMRHAKNVVVCSQSLSNIYRRNIGLEIGYIRNGIDTAAYSTVSREGKKQLRVKLNIPTDKVVLIYAARFIQRKNQRFLLEVFKNGTQIHNTFLLLLSDGPEYAELKEQYGGLKSVDFRGRVESVIEYLQASDVYISSSKSEGLPAGVLEAMSVGLPVVLSDIEQHKEILDCEPRAGVVYRENDEQDCLAKIQEMTSSDLETRGTVAAECARSHFGLERMCREYQDMYSRIAEDCKKSGQKG